MAIFSKLLVGSALFSALAVAVPVVKGRDVSTVVDVVTETSWTTVDVTTTVYVDNVPTTTASVNSTTAELPSTSMVSSAAAVSTGSSAEPTTTAAATTTAVMATSADTAAVATSSAAANVARASTDGTCEGDANACVGDVTHWDGGLGACGTVVNSETDLAIALPYEFMGTLSNTNPYCGRSVTLLNPTSGTTVNAVVADKCMGCVDRAIDCTDLLFNEITDGTGDGRVHGIEWWLN